MPEMPPETNTQRRLAPNLILCGNETYQTRRARHGGARKISDSCTRHSILRYPSSLKSCSATTPGIGTERPLGDFVPYIRFQQQAKRHWINTSESAPACPPRTTSTRWHRKSPTRRVSCTPTTTVASLVVHTRMGLAGLPEAKTGAEALRAGHSKCVQASQARDIQADVGCCECTS
jgi:hypothetical protein